jgi:hypothetical protein
MNKIFIVFILFFPVYCFSQNIDYNTGNIEILQSTSVNNLFIDMNIGQEIINDYINLYIKTGENHLTQTNILVDRYEFELTDNQKYYVDTIMQCLIDSAVFDKLQALYFGFYGHDDQAAYQNWIGDYDNLTQINGDIYFLAKWGIKGTGVASGPCLTMQSTVKTICDSSKYSFGVFLEERSIVTSFFNGAHNGVSLNWIMGYDAITNGPYGYLNGSTVIYNFGSVPFMGGWSRNGNNCYGYKNGTQVGTDTDTPSPLPAYSMYILGRNNSNVNQASHGGRISCFYISIHGIYLTANEHRAIYNTFIKWKNYVDAIF